jgi:NAD(P)H-dependent FMN reductase
MDKILFIVGSNRKGSFNKQLAKMAEPYFEGKAEVSYLEYLDVPFINQDTEFPTPAPVARVRETVRESDGIWIFTPEYNGSIPGLLKNLLDWLSRPVALGSADPIPVKDEPVVVAGAGGRFKAAGACKEALRLCKFIGMDVVDTPPVEVAIGAAYGTGVLVIDDETKAELQKTASALLEEIDKLKG